MRGYFGIGVENLGNQFNYGTLFRSALSFGASFVFVIGRRFEKQSSDTTRSHRHLPTYHFESTLDFLHHRPHGAILVGVECSVPNTTSLYTFIHPPQCVYILGSESNGLTSTAMNACNVLVHVPDAEFCLNVAVAGSIIMHDRRRKQNVSV